MRSSVITLIVIAALVAIGVLGQLGHFPGETPRYEPARPREAPRRPVPDADTRTDGDRPLPPPSRGDPTVDVSIPLEQPNSTGTAFSLDGSGIWMSARHVADGCSRIFVLTGPRTGHLVRRVYIHPTADIAIFRTDRGAPPVALTAAPPRLNESGFHFGYPHGEPGAVLSTLIGRATRRARGRYATQEPVLVWAERAREPDSEESLGGISGGPAFDVTGRLVGVTVAGSVRRGRVFTADLTSVRAALQRANVPAPAGSATVPRLDTRNWVREGAALRARLTIAKVVCLADRPRGVRSPRYAAPDL